MSDSISRRGLLITLPAFSTAMATRPTHARTQEPTIADPSSTAPTIHPTFPSQDPKLVREIVGASHRDLARVQALLETSPALAKAAWDWGFGDWETALGAASHVGNHEIAQLLIAHGARPDLFTFAMLGQLDVVKATIIANPGIQRIAGPHGLTLLHHARAGGDPAQPVFDYLQSLGDADLGPTPAPLSDADQARYIGKYATQDPSVLQFETQRDRLGNLSISRKPDGNPLRLTHLGNHEFHPSGAPAVRIRFTLANDRATELTIIDGPPILTAVRIES